MVIETDEEIFSPKIIITEGTLVKEEGRNVLYSADNILVFDRIIVEDNLYIGIKYIGENPTKTIIPKKHSIYYRVQPTFAIFQKEILLSEGILSLENKIILDSKIPEEIKNGVFYSYNSPIHPLLVKFIASKELEIKY